MKNNNTPHPLSGEEQKVFNWICGPYFSGVHSLMDSNRTYLNQGISWSIGILTAVIIFALTYISPLQEVKSPSGTVTGRSLAAVLQNLTDADVILLTAVISLSFAFVSNFLSRSIKGYLNLIRYVGLYSHCLRVSSSPVPVTPDMLRELTGRIRQYDDDFCPPLPLGTVFWKMVSELGYGLFLGILILLYIIAAAGWFHVESTLSGFWFWGILAFGPVWLIVELVFLKHLSNYFRYKDYAVESWSEVREPK